MNTPQRTIEEVRRLASPVPTPQALAWHKGTLWIGSRDERRLVGVDPREWTVVEEADAPGIPWSAVARGDGLTLVLGEGAEDDRYLRRFGPREGFDPGYRVPVPEMTGSYLSSDQAGNLFLSQWYNHRVLQLAEDGTAVRTIDVEEEICGHTFVGDHLYILRGTEQNGESWRLARLDPREDRPTIEDVAQIPFACRSLGYDGVHFWTNHRARHETVCFARP